MVSKWYQRNPWKQPVDQLGHTAWGFVIGCALFHPPWWPLLAVPAAGYLMGREQTQGGSDHFWGRDPHLDWTFYFLGAWLASWI